MGRSDYADKQVINLPQPDYDAADVLVVREPEQLKALGDDLRSRIVVLLRERAQSTTELAEQLKLPKGTVGHHVKVLEKAGLIRVVRTRQVRALTESYYGRTARLFLLKSEDADAEDAQNAVTASLRRAIEEMLPPVEGDRASSAVLRMRLSAADARRFEQRLDKLQRDFLAVHEDPDGRPYGLIVSLFRRAPDA
jgi:DNA-binding transcriptional ArsR family regulator